MENITFEEALKKLEEIVKELENKELNLEEAVKKYSEGLKISKLCTEKLGDSEQLLLKIMTENGLENFTLKKEE